MHITMQTCLEDNVSSLEPVENTFKVHTGVGVGVLVRLPKRSSRQKDENSSDFLTVTRVQGRPTDSEYDERQRLDNMENMQGRPPDKSTKCKLRELDIDTRVCCGNHITMEQTGA